MTSCTYRVLGQDLALTSNHLTALPDGLCALTRLVRLTVDANYLERLPRKLGRLHRLKVLRPVCV